MRPAKIFSIIQLSNSRASRSREAACFFMRLYAVCYTERQIYLTLSITHCCVNASPQGGYIY